jgi:HSP20 family molecular chaperone IbpA
MEWEITPWRPFEFDRIRREMDRLWDSFLEGRTMRRSENSGEWLPSIDVSETKNDLIIKAEFPGMDSKDIDISLSNGYLTIKGEKKQEKDRRRMKITISSREVMDPLPVRFGLPERSRVIRLRPLLKTGS